MALHPLCPQTHYLQQRDRQPKQESYRISVHDYFSLTAFQIFRIEEVAFCSLVYI